MAEEQALEPWLAAILPESYDLLAPYFDPANTWAGQTHEHLAYMALHERFPDLLPDQLTLVVDAMRKLFSTPETTNNHDKE